MHATESYTTVDKKQLRNAYYKNDPNLLFEHQCTSGKFIRLPNRIESKLFLPELECSNTYTYSTRTGIVRYDCPISYREWKCADIFESGRFPELAISNSISNIFLKQNIQKQFYHTALENCYDFKLP